MILSTSTKIDPWRTPETPVVLFTAYGSPEVEREALRRWAVDYWGKTIPIPALIERVRALGIPVRHEAMAPLGNQPHGTPERPGLLQEGGVHIQRHDGRPPDGCPTNHALPVLAPTEVLLPTVRARVKQWHQPAGARISGFPSIAFCDVAVGAGEAQVVGCRLAAGSPWDDMIQMKRLSDEDLWRAAVFTPPGGPRFHLSGQQSRNPDAHGWALLRFSLARRRGC